MRLVQPSFPKEAELLRYWLTVGALLLAILASARAKDDQQRLREEVKVSAQQAQDIAKTEQKGAIEDKRLVRDGTEPVYLFDIRGRDGLHLIKIDGITGDVLQNSVERPAPATAPPARPR